MRALQAKLAADHHVACLAETARLEYYKLWRYPLGGSMRVLVHTLRVWQIEPETAYADWCRSRANIIGPGFVLWTPIRNGLVNETYELIAGELGV